MQLWQVAFWCFAGLVCAFNVAILTWPRNRLVQRLTLPLRAAMMARRYHMPYRQARARLRLMDIRERRAGRANHAGKR